MYWLCQTAVDICEGELLKRDIHLYNNLMFQIENFNYVEKNHQLLKFSWTFSLESFGYTHIEVTESH